jgi:hypothetical protein
MELDSNFKLSPKYSIEFEKNVEIWILSFRNLKNELKLAPKNQNLLKCQNLNQIIKDL